MQPTSTPRRYAPGAQETRQLRRQINRFRYWRQHTHGGRARCCDVAIAIAERLVGIERSPAGTGKGRTA